MHKEFGLLPGDRPSLVSIIDLAIMFYKLLLTCIAGLDLVRGAAITKALAPRQASAADCPGYRASNVVETRTGLTADLELAGDACNVYGTDIERLRLTVNNGTGSYMCCEFTMSWD